MTHAKLGTEWDRVPAVLRRGLKPPEVMKLTSVPVLELRSGDYDIHGNVGFCGEPAMPKRVMSNWLCFLSPCARCEFIIGFIFGHRWEKMIGKATDDV